jgi:hypothetical protein
MLSRGKMGKLQLQEAAGNCKTNIMPQIIAMAEIACANEAVLVTLSVW